MAISPGFSPGISTQPVNKGGTGATTASGARSNLGLAASTTDNAICRFDGTSGSTQNSGVTIDDSGNLTVSGTGTINGEYVSPNQTTLNLSGSVPSLSFQDTNGGSSRNFTLLNSYTGAGLFELLAGTSAGAAPSVVVFKASAAGFASLGTTTNDNAATGYVGEYVSSTVAIGSAVSLTNTTPANMTSISLTAGDWDVEVNANYNLSGASDVTLFSGVNTTSATFGDNSTYSLKHTPMTTVTAVDGLVSTIVRVSLSGSATVYAVVRADFSAGTVGAFGSMRARRVR